MEMVRKRRDGTTLTFTQIHFGLIDLMTMRTHTFLPLSKLIPATEDEGRHSFYKTHHVQ